MIRYFFIVAALFLLSCSHKTSQFYPEIIPKRMAVTIPLKKDSKQVVNVTYLGCGNMILEQDGEAIMTDPFFSNQGFLKMMGKVKTKPDLYGIWKGRVQASAPRASVRAALVSHTHYDHVMDLPTIVHDHYFPKMDLVYGNDYLPKMMSNFKKEGVRFEALESYQVYNPTAAADSEYQWISVTPKIRFVPIESNHAPHTKRKLYMNKKLKEGYFESHLVWPGDKIQARKWTTGTTYSFLVDFIQGDTLRVFIQTSASQFKYGFPPEQELKKKGVDLAIICYASTPNVTGYPAKLMELIHPKKLMLVHWEDFFRKSRSDDDVRLVRRTNPKKVRQRINELGKKPDFFVMPKPGTKLAVTF